VEEVEPQVPAHQDLQESLAYGNEGSRLQDGIGAEVVELHPIVVAQPPHEPARRRVEATLVQADEADDVALRGLGSLSDAGGTIHAGCGPVSATRR
jgi:hypothetical protein